MDSGRTRKPVANLPDAGIVWLMAWTLAQLDASDGFAIAMLGVMILAMGTVALLFFCMKRNVARRDPHVDALLEELENDEREAARLARTKPAATPAHPWERDADWWKNG